jgi:SAM-dependent methyltransferase
MPTNAVVKLIKTALGRKPEEPPARPGKTRLPRPELRRFLSDKPMLYQNAVEAAETYVSKLAGGEAEWLFSKPYEIYPGSPQYFRLMYDLLNVLQAMRIPVRGRILEVGSGPGWVTEILLMLGFAVESLEPAADMVTIARQRIADMATHYRRPTPPEVRFHTMTMEEAAFDAETFDAVLYFDSLHHCVDEEIVIEKSFHCLKPGGCIAVVEASWHPDFKQLEAHAIGEMERFGTLENFFSTDYLDILLAENGFVENRRYVAVNGFFAAEQLGERMEQFADRPIVGSNNVIAYKPNHHGQLFPSVWDFRAKTDVAIELLKGAIDGRRHKASLRVRLTNKGETLLDNNPRNIGHISLALRQGKPGTAEFIECESRKLLAKSLAPGEQLEMTLDFVLPDHASTENWALDGVAEGVFWFSNRDIPACPIP